MACDYVAIREANKAVYGNVGRWGRGVSIDRYYSSAHLVFELLQSAQGALKRRVGWRRSREVRFESDKTKVLRIQDPAGKVRTFTFDYGWREVAEIDDDLEGRED